MIVPYNEATALAYETLVQIALRILREQEEKKQADEVA